LVWDLVQRKVLSSSTRHWTSVILAERLNYTALLSSSFSSSGTTTLHEFRFAAPDHSTLFYLWRDGSNFSALYYFVYCHFMWEIFLSFHFRLHGV